MKAAVDVHYDDVRRLCRAAAVVFDAWTDDRPVFSVLHRGPPSAPYVSGEFFRRELPCLLPLLGRVRDSTALQVIIVDGHVDLGPERPGLGRHLFRALNGEVEVIGVAKRSFVGAQSLPVYRGRSTRPLWVSSTTSAESAAELVSKMHGAHRRPTLLTLVDHLARGLCNEGHPRPRELDEPR
jgi:deoxyribonuclease V